MSTRTGLLWDQKIMFARFLEECGVTCEHVTPHLLAAPFFRGNFVALVIPTGFANPAYSRLLPALRSSSRRIARFVEGGGKLLVFGAGIDRDDAYDWLPFRVTYRHAHRTGTITCDIPGSCADLFADYDPSLIECDGELSSDEGETVARMDGKPVLIRKSVGLGDVVVTTIHEYPSRKFVREYCSSHKETLF
ncbi:MAG: hypothetical protein LUQ01_01525 [Methanolinea sp.]|nr:hypothetical protein [Methanolinea sp.]